MGAIVAIGERALVQGFSLVGVAVAAAENAAAVRSAWRELPEDVALVILTVDAHAVLAAELIGDEGPLAVVMPG